jgi:hypothetical protein
MAHYSDGNVETKYLDPKSFIDGQRAVFELPSHHMAILPNLRLLNVGVVGANAGRLYNKLIGVDSLIKNIRLLDGRTELSKSRNYQLWKGFVNQNVRNTQAISKKSYKTLGQVGLMKNPATELLAFLPPMLGTNTASSTTNSGDIDLRDALPLLKNITHLPSDIFQNLKIEIEFTTVLTDQILNEENDTVNGQVIPTLAMDVIDDPKIVEGMRKNFNNVAWLEIEHDQVLFPQSANNGAALDQDIVQENNTQLDGFKNKRVNRLLMVKEDPVEANYRAVGAGTIIDGYGKYGSVGVRDEALQVRLNGRNILPRNGLVGDNERLGMLVDTYGDCFCYPGANNSSVNATEILEDGNKFNGNLSYNALHLGDKVMNLQINHKRTGEQRGGQPQFSTNALNVHFFAEVQKILLIGKGTYTVQYIQ